MARKHFVTRTVKAQVLDVLVCDLSTHDVRNETIVLPRTLPTEKETIKAAEKMLPENIKLLTIVSSTTRETLYGMPEEDFILNAKVLPPRTANADENTDETAE